MGTHPEEELNAAYQPTIGIDFMSKMLPHADGSIRFQIWDTAGQDKYRNLALNYLHEANAVIVMYDICNEASFKSVQTWVDTVHEMLGDAPLLALVGNKTDIADNRKVSTEEGNKLAQRLGADVFLETSAKIGDNVDVLFQHFASRLWNAGRDSKLVD